MTSLVVWRICPTCKRRWLPGRDGGAYLFAEGSGNLYVETCPECLRKVT